MNLRIRTYAFCSSHRRVKHILTKLENLLHSAVIVQVCLFPFIHYFFDAVGDASISFPAVFAVHPARTSSFKSLNWERAMEGEDCENCVSALSNTLNIEDWNNMLPGKPSMAVCCTMRRKPHSENLSDHEILARPGDTLILGAWFQERVMVLRPTHKIFL